MGQSDECLYGSSGNFESCSMSESCVCWDCFLLELSVAHVLASLVQSELSGVSEEVASVVPSLDFSMAASEVLKVDPKLQTLSTYRKLAVHKVIAPLSSCISW